MDLETLRPALIKDFLTAVAYHKEIPRELLALDVVKEQHALLRSSTGLQEFVDDLVIGKLLIYRTASASPAPDPSHVPAAAKVSRDEALARFSADFRQGNAVLKSWSALYYRYLSGHFFQVKELARVAGISTREIGRCLEEGRDYLMVALREAEEAAHARMRHAQLSGFLPARESALLFGRQLLIQKVFDLLRSPGGPEVVALYGMGGIGKTAAAQAVFRKFGDRKHFKNFAWLNQASLHPAEWQTTVRHDDPPNGTGQEDPERCELVFDEIVRGALQQLGENQMLGFDAKARQQALAGLLQAVPCLIMLDNIERLPGAAAIIQRFLPMLGQSRLLMAGRIILGRIPSVRSVSVPPLRADDSISLLRNELEQSGRDTDEVTDDALWEVFELTGGLPLALQLVAAQLAQGKPLGEIRAGLQRGESSTTQSLYQTIYRNTWTLLDGRARQLLMSMLVISPDGENREWLQLASNLSGEELDGAVALLINHCLLQVVGSLSEPLYRLHPLTVNFLGSELLDLARSHLDEV